MTVRRIELLATLLVLLATACAVLPPARTPTRAETRRVTIPGEEADTLAETSGDAEDGLVPLRTHDGRDVWVRETALAGATIVPGTWVLVRQEGQLLTVAVARSLDDFVEVDVAGTMRIVPIGDVLARLHHGPVIAATELPPPPVVAPLPPPTPLAQIVALDDTSSSRAGILDECSGGTGHVVFPDGTDTRVATSALHPLRVRSGDHVTALWSGGSPYPGTVLAVRDSLVRVRWEDETAEWVELTDVQSVDAAATGAIHGCPHGAVLVDEGPRTHVGRVLACEAGQATVLDANGTPRSVAVDALHRVPLRVGDAIEARWNGTPYDGIVLSIGERLHVRWYDASENDVDPADLVSFRAREARPTEAASCPDA